MVRYYLLFSGTVQGVGFRYFAEYTASRFSMTGFVHNRHDGKVEVEIQGGAPDAAACLAALQKGPRYAEIDGVELRELAVLSEEHSFRVLY